MLDRINRHCKEEWGGGGGYRDWSNEPSARISKAHTSLSIRTVVQYFLSHFFAQILNQQPVAKPHVNAISLQL